MTFEECKNKVAVKYGFIDWMDYVAFMINTKVGISKVILATDQAAELHATSQYNKALEDLKVKLQSFSCVQCDVCEGSNWKECGCRIEGQNEGIKFAISELEKLKK